MTVSGYDGNDTYVLGDDGSEDGIKITSTLDGPKKRLDVSAKLSGTSTVAETELATFTIYGSSIAIGNNKSMVSLLNASGSTVVLKIRDISIINTQTAVATGILADFRLLRCTGHSVGTTITPESHDTDDSLNASFTARTGGTIAGEGTAVYRRWQFSTDEWGAGSLDVESEQHAIGQHLPVYQQSWKGKAFTLRAGQGFTIKQVTNSTVGTFDLILTVTQE